MRKIEIEQGSSEWLELRTNKIGASDCSTIMGLNKFCTPLKLWQRKMGLIPFEPMNEKMQRGHDLEPLAREKFNKQMGQEFIPIVCESDNFSWMMASLDGICDNAILEIKSNGPNFHSIAENGSVPIQHLSQIQHQLFVTQCEIAYYYSFDGQEGITLEVYPDIRAIETLIEKERKFWECMQTFTPPM